MFLWAGAQGLHGGLGTQRSVTQWTDSKHTHTHTHRYAHTDMHRCFSLHLKCKYADISRQVEKTAKQGAKVNVFFTGLVICVCVCVCVRVCTCACVCVSNMLLNHSQLCPTCVDDESKYRWPKAPSACVCLLKSSASAGQSRRNYCPCLSHAK